MQICDEVSVYQIIYLLLLTASWMLSFYLCDLTSNMKVFPILLSLSWIVEITVSILYYFFCLKREYNILYHLYIPLEYTILAYFFYLSFNNLKIRKYILYSIPLYVIGSFIISFGVSSIYAHPGLNFNIEGVLLIIWSLIALFTVEPKHEMPLVKMPIFWICLGILIFHSGIFFFNGVFNYILKTNSPLAKYLFQLIIKNLNYTLYICFLIGFICSNRMKKYLLQS